MAVWTNPPDRYIFWSWVNEDGDGPAEEWDNPEEALSDLRESAGALPGVGRWLYKGEFKGDNYQKLEEEYIE